MESGDGINSATPDICTKSDSSIDMKACEKATCMDSEAHVEYDMAHMASIAISFCYRRRNAYIYKSVISALQNPAYIRLLINPEQKVVIIQGCNETERDAIKVPDNSYSGHSEIRINSIALLESITKLMGWSKHLTYRVKGKLLSEEQLIVFLLETAVVVREKEE